MDIVVVVFLISFVAQSLLFGICFFLCTHGVDIVSTLKLRYPRSPVWRRSGMAYGTGTRAHGLYQCGKNLSKAMDLKERNGNALEWTVKGTT